MRKANLSLAICLILSLYFLSECPFRAEARFVDLMSQNYQCQNLIMVKQTSSSGYKYVPNPTVPNNYLGDSFYQSLGLDNKNIDQGFALVRQIYTNMTNCNSVYCDCVKDFIDGAKVLFLDDSNFVSMKQIAADFNNNVPLQSSSMIDILMTSSTILPPNKVPPTLSRFVVKFDYTLDKGYWYNSFLTVSNIVCL